jgi:hypothetical protein
MSLSAGEMYAVLDACLVEIREVTEIDKEMQALKETVMCGRPEHRNETPLKIRHYYDFRDTIIYCDGLMLKVQAVIIPKSRRTEMKTRLYQAHFGYDSMIIRVRANMFGPGMNQDIKQIADCCSIYQEWKPTNQKAR